MSENERIKILVVDDDMECLQAMKDLLSESYDVTIEVSGKRALKLLETSRFDVLVTDVNMPGVSGIDLVRTIKHTGTKTILVTGYSEMEKAAAEVSSETLAVFRKPLEIGRFFKALETVRPERVEGNTGGMDMMDAELAKAKKAAAATQSDDSLIELAGKYLTFKLGEEDYGLEILKVQEIIKMQEITKVPRTPDFMRGVINLRGKVIPVVDLRLKFGMEEHETTDMTCIIVLQVSSENGSVTMGVVVDEVSEVLDIAGEDIEATPSLGTTVDTAFVMAMAKTKGSVKMLLDIDKVLSQAEIAAMNAAA